MGSWVMGHCGSAFFPLSEDTPSFFFFCLVSAEWIKMYIARQTRIERFLIGVLHDTGTLVDNLVLCFLSEWNMQVHS